MTEEFIVLQKCVAMLLQRVERLESEVQELRNKTDWTSAFAPLPLSDLLNRVVEEEKETEKEGKK